MKKMIILAACMVLVATAAFAGISNTKHDLGTGSTSGGYVAAGTNEICVFCHTPHGAAGNGLVPLWNRSTTGSTFAMYSGSATLNATIGTLGGASLACMSCHDGTLTLTGNIVNQPNAGAATAGAAAGNVAADLITGAPNLGVNLANDHPVSFTYDAALVTADTVGGVAGLRAPGAITNGAVLIGTQVECASCHQVHDNTNVPFLRGTMNRSALCLGCHIK